MTTRSATAKGQDKKKQINKQSVIEKISRPLKSFEKQSKGGARPGAGRKPGMPNKNTQRVILKVESTGITPLDYMLQVMRDVVLEPKERLAAAVSAAPYVHAKLSSVEMKASVITKTFAEELAELNAKSDSDSE